VAGPLAAPGQARGLAALRRRFSAKCLLRGLQSPGQGSDQCPDPWQTRAFTGAMRAALARRYEGGWHRPSRGVSTRRLEER
jgi:hypothetical protein